MAHVRAAGTHSGANVGFLDSNKPFSGLISDILKKEPSSSSWQGRPTPMMTGDMRHAEVLTWGSSPNHMAGGIPKSGGRFQEVAIPGYKGHIAGKVAENMHGQTFSAENTRAMQLLPLRQMRRTVSAPVIASAPSPSSPSKGRSPKLPGYTGHMPATDHHHHTAHGWLRPGNWPADRMATYKWNNKTPLMDCGDRFTQEQEMMAYESNKKLGQVFGLQMTTGRGHKPADRYIHSTYKMQSRTSTKEGDPAAEMDRPAGRPSISPEFDAERTMAHRNLGLGKSI